MRMQNGQTLGPYVVQGLLGAGGMGEVYRARDPRLGRDVAIKVLSALPEAGGLARFEQEARATALLAHPNILTVFDVGVEEGAPYLVCELLEGETVRQRLASGPFGVVEALELAVQLGRGIAAAHSLRIVHRDLKPENLFLTRSGALKILDFGLAKLRPASDGGADAPTIDATQPGIVLGTIAYMAPEQLRGEPVDERADIFATGSILLEMVSGLHPFRKKSSAETIAAVLEHGSITIRSEHPLPPALERIVLRCLEKDAGQRYANAGDLVLALESLLGDERRLAERAPPARREEASSIAVLPFLDMSPGRDQDYLCEGIAEEVINALTHVEGLRVAARGSSFQFNASGVDTRAVGARLGVEAVLEGGVRKVGDRLRVTVRLVDVSDGYQRWSQRYDRKLEDVFAVQDEIAESVATALRGILRQRGRGPRRSKTTPEAHEYFLRGRQAFHGASQPNCESARRMFERAIEIDPSYGRAYAGLAMVNAWFYEWFGGHDTDLEAAKRASRKALDLSPDLEEAHTSLGLVLSLEGKYAEAEHAFEEALRLNPSSYTGHYLFARTCFSWGQIERSANLFRRAAELRQEDYQSMILLGQSLEMLGRHEESRAANLDGIRRAERQLELDPVDRRALSLGANALCSVGDHEQGLRWSARALELHPDDQSVLVNRACMCARLGRKEEALDLLERTMAIGSLSKNWVEHDPDYDSLRDHPRFTALIAKLR